MATPAPQLQSGGGTVSVQHVAKASSDELLRKFADPDAAHRLTPPRHSLALRRKRSSRRVASGLSARDSDAGAAGIELAAPKRRQSISGSAEWKAGLLLPTTEPRRGRQGGGGLVGDGAQATAWACLKGGSAPVTSIDVHVLRPIAASTSITRRQK